MCKEAYMKGETCASSIVEDLLDEFRRGTGLHRKVNLGARLKMDFQYILLGYDYAYFILFFHVFKSGQAIFNHNWHFLESFYTNT